MVGSTRKKLGYKIEKGEKFYILVDLKVELMYLGTT
jgi:hypothetical protein